MRRSPTLLIALLTCLIAGRNASAGALDEFKIKRQDVFEFAEKPQVARHGDQITITFTSKANCDATVAIETADGRIVRHLASGVLGSNAPIPFQTDSLKQSLI